MRFLQSIWFPLFIFIATVLLVWHEVGDVPVQEKPRLPEQPEAIIWKAPSLGALGNDSLSEQIRYGRELIANTAKYLGPRGSIAVVSNGMNCQNCHIDAGARPFGNCFAAVAATYPQYRPRSGRIETIEFRINDCLQRSLNGQTIDSLSREMRAMVSYLVWLGKDVPRNTRPPGAGVQDLTFLERAASAAQGKTVYEQYCARCHGTNGEGQLNFDSVSYAYPPLWGIHSYNTGAGLYRVSRLAAYVRDNMPFGVASHESPQLSTEEAWDVAAFINSQPRPEKKFAADWPDISKKAFDHPFGPYTDNFSELQHKYGPFEPIKKARAAKGKNNTAGGS